MQFLMLEKQGFNTVSDLKKGKDFFRSASFLLLFLFFPDIFILMDIFPKFP